MKLILGSSSKPRAELLHEWGFGDFEIVKPDINEKSVRDDDPENLVVMIAEAKADAVMPHVSDDSFVITSDSIAVVGGEIREKPDSKEEAYRWIRELSSGVPLDQVTSVSITRAKDSKRLSAASRGTVVFDPLPDDGIAQFVESGDVFHFAGAYVIEDEPFFSHIQRIEGEYETIVGLPKKLTLAFLKELGYSH